MAFQDHEARRIDSELRVLVGNERGVVVDFLKTLDEFDRRRGWAELEYGGLWEYVRSELGFREACTTKRIHAMNVLRRFPQVEAFLRDGRLCLTSLLLMKDLLDEENVDRVIAATAGRSTREIERFVAETRPAPVDPNSYLRRLSARKVPIDPAVVAAVDPIFSPAPAATAEEVIAAAAPDRISEENGPIAGTVLCEQPSVPQPIVSPQPAPRGDRRDTMKPLHGDRSVLNVVVSGRFREKLERSMEILSHVVPRKDFAAALEAGLDLLLEKHERKLKGPAKTRPTSAGEPAAPDARKPAPGAGFPLDNERSVLKISNRISAEVRRAVYARDHGCCQWKMANGQKCGSRWQTEVDHIEPEAMGGASTVENCRVLCRKHNLLHARRCFGDAKIDAMLERDFPRGKSTG